MQTSNQTLKFIIADFVTGWRRRVRSYGVIEYLALANGGKLKVVTTEPSGEMKTYFYQVSPRGIVTILNDVIHIPSRAFEKHEGNIIEMEA